MTKSAIILPAFEEEKYLDSVLKSVCKFNYPVIVIDDGSKDRTSQIALRYTPYVLRHEINLGKGAALKTGCDFAFRELKVSSIVMLDSDAQHDPRLITDFLQKVELVPVVFGVRAFGTEMPKFRALGNRIVSIVMRLLLGVWMDDILCGYKAIRADAYEQIRWQSSEYAVEIEIAARVAKAKLDFATIRVPTVYHDYARGMTILDAAQILRQLIRWGIPS